MNAGYAAQEAKSPKEPSLNERLNKTFDSLTYQCERIESVLARVNGTPPTPAKLEGNVTGQIRPTFALSQVVDNLEQVNQRLSSLAVGIEKIA